MAVSYWLRMAQGTENVLLNDAFACAKIDDHPWLQDIRHLLYKNGFGYAWEHPPSVHPKRFSRLVLNRLDDQAVQMWRNKMGCSSRFKLLTLKAISINKVNTWT